MNSRPIKFRVWDKTLGRYIPYSCYLSFDNPEYVFEQYTGLKDGGGREIYEGDILMDKNGFSYQVFWFDQTASFEFKELEESLQDYATATFRWNEVLRLKVVGSAFENPELLKKCNE